MEPQSDNHWHLDKKVPITLIFVLLVQLAGGIWYAGRSTQRQDDQERRINTIEQQNVSGRLGSVEGQLQDVKAGVSKINDKLDRIIEREPRK